MKPFSAAQRCAGFTLIELMITVAIVAILAAIAYPSYTAYVHRANRTDATKTLLQDAQALERCYSQNFAYSGGATACPVTAGTTASPNGYYSIVVQIPAADSYTITATPTAGSAQANDSQCASFTLLSNGKQSAADSSAADSTKTCWGSN